MKYCAFGIGALAILQSAHGHLHHHGNHVRRQDTEATSCPEVKYTSTVVVHVDQQGHTLSVETEPTRNSATPLTSRNALPSSSSRVNASFHNSASSSSALFLPSSIPQQQRNIPEQPELENPIDMDSLDDLVPPSSSSEFFRRNKYGISYSPYKADNKCKTQNEVDDDIRSLRQFPLVRIYGVDCNQAQTVTKAARQNRMKVFAGVYNIDSLNSDLQDIIDAADGDWSSFHTISVGNEIVNRGQNSPAEVVDAVNAARDRLRQAGYEGPVVTVDTFSQILVHPELCDASDYCAANCHAFFDATQTPDNAGPYVLEQARRVSEVSGGKKVIITETGWPSAGVPNGKAVPSRHNQKIALRSLQDSFPDGGIILFSAFDDKWKQDNAWTFGTEKHWGISEPDDGGLDI